MKLYLRGNKWWAKWSEGGVPFRRTTRTTHRDEAEAVVASWGRKVDMKNVRPARAPRPRVPVQDARASVWGWLYFVIAKGTDRIKIGFTRHKDIAIRLRGLQTGCPYPLELLATLRVPTREERHYHGMFARDRVMPNTEWFITSTDVMHAVQMAREGATVCPRCTRA